MEILKTSSENVMQFLGYNPYYKDKKYRLNKYCFIHNYKGVKLILNELTRSMVAIREDEFSNIYEIEKAYDDPNLEYVLYLIKNYFLVLEDYNECEKLELIREHERPVIDDLYLKEVYDYIILPTTTCNARCFYCYEKPMSKMPMSIDMAERVSRYIMKKAPNKNNTIVLRWFGGEPLFNMKAMRYIMNSLKANGYNISSSMISNGYLFNEKIIEEAINEWNLSFVQITLDGTEEVYNKAKNYIYKNQDEISPFKKVIENIDILTSKGVTVSIRMNTDMYNVEDLKKLVVFLGKKFEGRSNLNAYCYQIFEDKENPRTDEEKKLLYEKLNEINDLIEENNLNVKTNKIDNFIRITHCMVDSGKSINIHPDGTLGLCEHYIDSDCWGYINENSNEVITNWEFVHEWRDYLTNDRCKDCKLYPICIRTRKCEDLARCDVFFQEYKYIQERKLMESKYDELLRIIEERNNCCDGNSCSCGNQDSFICNCVSQSCDSKANWCYCISQKQEVENINNSEQKTCDEKTCKCKKEETPKEEVIDQEKVEEKQEEQKVKKSLWEKIKDILD